MVILNVKQCIKKLLFAIEKDKKADVQYSVIYGLKIDGEYERYTSELDVMKRLIEVHKNGYWYG